MAELLTQMTAEKYVTTHRKNEIRHQIRHNPTLDFGGFLRFEAPATGPSFRPQTGSHTCLGMPFRSSLDFG